MMMVTIPEVRLLMFSNRKMVNSSEIFFTTTAEQHALGDILNVLAPGTPNVVIGGTSLMVSEEPQWWCIARNNESAQGTGKGCDAASFMTGHEASRGFPNYAYEGYPGETVHAAFTIQSHCDIAWCHPDKYVILSEHYTVYFIWKRKCPTERTGNTNLSFYHRVENELLSGTPG